MQESLSDAAGSAASIESQLQQAVKQADSDIVYLNAWKRKALDKQKKKEQKAAEKLSKTVATQQDVEE